MLARAALSFFNHLLAGEDWARTRLKVFSGQHLQLELGPLRVRFSVAGDGSLHTARSTQEPSVTVRLPDDLPRRLLSGPAAIAQATRISGSADFAETLGFVVRNLRWDAEGDLARVVGDIPARRIGLRARAAVRNQSDAAQRLAANFVEYATGESGFLVHPETLASFSAEARQLSEDLARLDQRLASL